MRFRRLLQSLAGIALSISVAGVFYIGWLAVFIPAFKAGIGLLRVAGWLSAPVVTSLGFATGLWVGQRAFGTQGARFRRIFIWPLIGCSLGAAAVFPFGPMLIVFGMFLAGTASVVLCEALDMARSQP